MPSSDFGDDNDDTAIIAAATQVEVLQPQAGFAASPRPTKRRRVSPNGEYPESISQDPQGKSSTSQSASALASATTDASTIAHESPEVRGGGYHLLGESEEDNISKASKHRIHVPKHGGKFPDLIFTQTQHNLDENPAEFRGPVWKRPSEPESGHNERNIAGTDVLGPHVSQVKRPQIRDYFKTAERNASEAADRALAARIQAEEFSRRGYQGAQPIQIVSNDTSFDQVNMSQFATELEDLPSDAFSSSSPEKSPTRNVIDLSSQSFSSQKRDSGSIMLRGPRVGLRQMTIFGQPATQELTASQAANKRHAWPLSSREEPPTHHELDKQAIKTWLYPINLGAVRDYQYNIVSRSLYHNTLVALPTGLGKTFIAATVMLNYYRWTTDAQMVFMAPTKPLISQQMEACYGIVGIPRRDTVLMTGETTPAVRADEWLEKRVFFMTPQTVINDLKTGICDPKKLVLLVVDEAHKATGGYAYTEVISFVRRFNSSFRVLALTATPGSSTESVQAVIDNLDIARVELRTETSLDIREYTHEKQTETEVFDFNDEQVRIMELCSRALRPSLEKLASQNGYWSRDPMTLTAFGLTQARKKWMISDAGRKAPMNIKGMINAIFTVLSGLAHSIGLLKFHGIGPFYSGMLAFQNSVNCGEQKGKTAAGIAQSDAFVKMISTMRPWIHDPEFIGHPKLEYLREVVLNHFLDAGEGRQGSDLPPSATRVMIFASYRDSTEEICRVLKRSEPMIRPHVFVGQAASKGQEGMDQKRQNAVIQDFKNGKFNTLIATSIGEEGLDIGTVDLIVCYDASASPIRMLQRIGRTGRKRVGRVVLLLMKGKEEKDYEKAQDNYLVIQKSIANPEKYTFRDDRSPRILPRDVKPVADKRRVEIPVENSQPVDLNEKGKRAKSKSKAKRPPKKFHMPDGVRTGFTTASRMDDSPSEDDRPNKSTVQRKPVTSHHRRAEQTPEPEAVQLPYLMDVFLTIAELRDMEEKYMRTKDVEGQGFARIRDISRSAGNLTDVGRGKHIQHGQTTRLVEGTMKAMLGMDEQKLRGMDDLLHLSDIEDAGEARFRLVSPRSEHGTVTSANDSREQTRFVTATENLSSRLDTSKNVASGTKTATTTRKGPPSRQPRGRQARAARAMSLPAQPESEFESEAELPEAIPAPAVLAARSGPKPKHKRRAHNRVSYISAAGEGQESSSPEPTPADMRTGLTQGEALGSEDTSGADEEQEPDSDDRAFIATSDPVDNTASSSQFPVEPSPSEDDEECDLHDTVTEIVVARGDRKRRRVVTDSDDDNL